MTRAIRFANVHFMKADFDILFVATRLVEEMGESAVRMSRVKLVELTAANQMLAADFWRQVLKVCETQLADRAAAGQPAIGQSKVGDTEAASVVG